MASGPVLKYACCRACSALRRVRGSKARRPLKRSKASEDTAPNNVSRGTPSTLHETKEMVVVMVMIAMDRNKRENRAPIQNGGDESGDRIWDGDGMNDGQTVLSPNDCDWHW